MGYFRSVVKTVISYVRDRCPPLSGGRRILLKKRGFGATPRRRLWSQFRIFADMVAAGLSLEIITVKKRKKKKVKMEGETVVKRCENNGQVVERREETFPKALRVAPVMISRNDPPFRNVRFSSQVILSRPVPARERRRRD